MVLTTDLLEEIRDSIKTELQTNFTHGAVGSDSTTPTSADTTLGNELFRDTVDDFDTSGTDVAVANLQITLSELNGETIREVGWFNASSSGTMWTRNVLTAINKTDDIQVFVDTSITINVTEG